MKIQKLFWIARRAILKLMIPEIVWPKEVLLDGVPIQIRNSPYSFGTKKLLISGEYEKEERQLILKEIRHDDIIVEMGGSIGVLTVLMAEKLSGQGSIISIEASKTLSNYSRKLLGDHEKIEILTGIGFPVAHLTSNISIKKFDESGGSLGGRITFELESKNSCIEETKQPIFDIDRIVNKFHKVPTVLVIDIEGSEKILLDVKADFPKQIRIVMIELHPSIYGNEIMDKIIEILKNEGFCQKKELSGVYLFKRVD